MNMPAWEIGRAMGIPIRVHASWFLVFVFVTWTLATGYLPETLPGLSDSRYWGMGAIAALLLFLSVLLHELGHSYVAQRYRIPIGQITLFLFGGVAHMGKEPPSPRAEFFIAIAGPVVSFALGILCFVAVLAVEMLPVPWQGHGFIVLGGLLGFNNVVLGLFNLIPGFPLDGGRVLRAGLWAWTKDLHRATGQAAVIGLGFGILLGGLGAFLVVGAISGGLDGSMASHGGWLMFIGAFLSGTAWSTRRQTSLRTALSAAAVRDVMIRAVVSVPPHVTIQAVVDDYFVTYGYGGFPVSEAEQILGLITVQDVQSIPQALWSWRVVRDVMRPASPQLFIPPGWSVMQAMERMVQENCDRLIVAEEGQPVGLITRSAIAQFLQLHSQARSQKRRNR
jgi:Zn-dependent protease/predicted transcriptional regulator